MNRREPSLTLAEIDLAASDWVVRRSFGLTPDERAELARWEAADPRHADALARHAMAWAMLDRPRNVGKGELIMGELGARATWRRRRRAGAAAAAIAAACLLAVMWRGERISSPLPGAPSMGSAVVLLPERRTLPDGSIVELKAAAKITVDFSAGLRRVILRRGEAHFEVVRNPERPFVVSAGGVEVRAVGTAFAVELGKSAVAVVVTEGIVTVEKGGTGSRGRKTEDSDQKSSVGSRSSGEDALSPPAPVPRYPSSVVVDAGNRVVVEIGDGSAPMQKRALPPAELAQRLAWRAPRVEFMDTPLAEAVALMNRHSTVRIEIPDPALARMRVNGLFRADNTDTFIRLLEKSFDAKAERSGDVVVLNLLTAPGRE